MSNLASPHARHGIVFLHGFLGSPKEYGDLEKTFAALGFQTLSITLPGHDLSIPTDHHAISAQALVAAAEDAIHALSRTCDQVTVVGHSMGGVLALIASAHASIQPVATIVLSAPFRHVTYLHNKWQALRRCLPYLMHGIPYLHYANTGHKRPIFPFWAYGHLRQEARWLFDALEDALPQLKNPVLVLHGRYDLTVPVHDADEIFARVGSTEKKLDILPRCGHQIFPHSPGAMRAARLITEFILEHSRMAEASGAYFR